MIEEKTTSTEASIYLNKELIGVSEDKHLMDTLIYLAPFIQKIVPLDCMIGVSDKQKMLALINGEEIKPPFNPVGQDLPEADALYISMKQNKLIDMIVPKEALGIEFKSTAVPIKNMNGQIIGSLGLGIGLRNRNKLIDLAGSVAASSQETSATIEQLTSSAEKLTQYQDALKQLGQEVAKEVGKTTEILSFIRKVAQNSNLLGLNAAIEAARAGDQGRGFAVVAEEIRKMAENSASAVKDIENIISSVKHKTEQMLESVIETTAIGQEQLAASEEISGVMEELAVSAQELNEAASLVIG